MNPQRLGSRYLLHDKLGRGAMGVVWRGQDLETGAWVAVKLLRSDYAASPAAVSRFVGERNALIRFRHPNVVNLRDMIVEGDRLALVMDLITDGDLDAFRKHGGGALAPDVAVRMTAQICDGLAAAHAAGIIHRDLKPSNVLLQGGQVKLADFGIARIAGDAKRTTAGVVMGTPTYLSPEVINGAEPTAACDVYAVGVTLYELLAGRPPFEGHVVAVMQAHLRREPDRISGISGWLWDVIAACLSKDPAGRPTADDMARSLNALEYAGAAGLAPWPAQVASAVPALPTVAQSPSPTERSRPTGKHASRTQTDPPSRASPGRRRRQRDSRTKLLAGTAALVAVLAVVGVVLATSQSNHTTPPPAEWQCGSGSQDGQTITACIRSLGNELQVYAKLTNVLEGSEQIRLTVTSRTGNTASTYSFTCRAGSGEAPSTCTTPTTTVNSIGSGQWYVNAEEIMEGSDGRAQANSPAIDFTG